MKHGIPEIARFTQRNIHNIYYIAGMDYSHYNDKIHTCVGFGLFI